TWFGLVHRTNRVVTPLERWLREREPDFEPPWQLLSVTTTYLLGSRMHECSHAPPVWELRPVQDALVRTLDEAALRDLIHTLRHAPEDQQRQLIQRLGDRLLDSIESSSPTQAPEAESPFRPGGSGQ
ncbi:MAG: hypothetical protein D6766_04730, partial [Verrucomicrobia bacterium]